MENHAGPTTPARRSKCRFTPGPTADRFAPAAASVGLVTIGWRRGVHVLDRFHIMKQLGEAIDDVRAGEARRMKQDGYEPVLKHSRWCLLKRPENLTDRQTVKLTELLKYNLQSVRAYLHREDFQRFWEYQSPGWAGKFLDEWSARVNALTVGTAQESGPQPAETSRAAFELVPRQRYDFGR
jgi:transposase